MSISLSGPTEFPFMKLEVRIDTPPLPTGQCTAFSRYNLLPSPFLSCFSLISDFDILGVAEGSVSSK